jgi:hypothetical protein
MPSKLEIWQELGRRYGVPNVGTPEYEQKKRMYKEALLHVQVTEDNGNAPPCTCPCYCDAKRTPPRQRPQHSHDNYTFSDQENDFDNLRNQKMTMGDARRVVQREHIPQRQVSESSDEEQSRRQVTARRKGRKILKVESDSDDGSESESDQPVKKKATVKKSAPVVSKKKKKATEKPKEKEKPQSKKPTIRRSHN